MRELRLTDPNGYSVPGAVLLVADDHRDTDPLLEAAATSDAAEQGYDPRDYRIRNTPA